MRKKLSEVFQGLAPSKYITPDLLDSTEVERLAYSEDRRTVNAFLVFHRLADKPVILSLEKSINERFFPKGTPVLRIRESYELNDYSLPDIVTLYRDSAVLDLSREYPAFSSLLKRSVWEVGPDGRLLISFEGNPFARNYAREWSAYIEKRFQQRFGIHVNPVLEFTEKALQKEPEEKIPESVPDVSPEEIPEIPDNAPDNTPDNTPDSFVPEIPASLPEVSPSVRSQKTSKRSRKNNQEEKMIRPYRIGDPDVLYGRPFKDASQKLSSYLPDEEGPMVVLGEILSVETKPTKNGEKTIFIFALTDYTDSIRVKFFIRNEFLDEVKAALFPGRTVLVKGDAEIDHYDHELMIQHLYGIMRYDLPLVTERKDEAPVKRVELHAHTKYSDNDSVLDAEALIKRAASFGHPAVAVTDHGNVQAYPTVMKAAKAMKEKGKPVKVLYGMEGYMVDDTQAAAGHPTDAPLSGPMVVFDLETTGFSSERNKIIEIGAVRIENGVITDRFSSFVNPREKISYRIESLTGITNEDLVNAPSIEEVLPKFMAFTEGCFLVGHNAEFDISFLIRNLQRVMPGTRTDLPWADTLGISRFLLPKLTRHTLDHVAKELGVPLLRHHRAVDDAECTAGIYLKFLPRLESRGIMTLRDVAEKCRPDADMIRKMNHYHVCIFIRNEEGRKALYRIISDSNLLYFRRNPRIPKSVLLKYRKDLIIGSACSEGQLFDAVLRGIPDEELARIVSFYDYLEIQPIGNNAYLIRKEDYDYIRSDEDLRDLNRQIVSLGEQFQKPVCATGDVHFMDPEDAVYRTFLQDSQDYKDAEEQPPLYFRTTDEMLSEFDYLGSDKAREVVIENPRKIADMVEEISPIDKKKSPPVIDGSDQDLRDHAFMIAKELYGDPLPVPVEERLERELNAIISNGYAVMYSIAHKLIKKSMSDGYLVGSRGSVGSSLAATMYEITEINPLPPHYRCPKCRYSEFDSKECIEYQNHTGWDMPDKMCPKCGTKLIKDGCNIPFETFMGFKGDKEPDIDLNFSGEYQAKAHAYTEVIFGKGQTFKAGTVQAVKDKIGSTIVYKYFQKKGINKRNAEIDRLGTPLLGVKRSTGQHPGGIIVLPLGEDINRFTPVQHPADDTDSSIVTTQFDYHSIEHNLLKLDILGKDDPTVIRMLKDLLGVDPVDFPLDSPEALSLFKSTDALGIRPSDIHDCPLGVLGIPEFGTDNAISMLLEAKPEDLSDLIRISGLAHGTDVWHGNAEKLIKEGTATLRTAVCTRDDIMQYLISVGMDNAEAFSIMESVRKGKVAKKDCPQWPKWKADMEAHGVPAWYIWSCEHIMYMFPKAHAAAYVVMGMRIAYAKVFHPLEYYATYFSIKASGFDYETMCMGHARMEEEYNRLKAISFPKEKEKARYRDIRIVEEMYARGFSFVPIDLYKAQADRFTIVNDKQLMPSFGSIEGMGPNVAQALQEAAKQGPYTSIQNLKSRAKVSQTLLDKMESFGILSGLPKDDQISFMDFI